MKIQLDLSDKELTMLMDNKQMKRDEVELVLNVLNRKLGMTNSVMTNWSVDYRSGRHFMEPNKLIMHTINIETPHTY